MPYKVGDYARFHSSARMKQERVVRNRNRRAALRTGAVRKGDGRQIDHVDGNPRNNSRANLKIISGRTNRQKQ